MKEPKKDKRKRNSIGDKYTRSKASAKFRGIPFRLAFDEWLKIWTDSGHLGRWGKGSSDYCMSRFGDMGAYEIGNVEIKTNAENVAERNRNSPGFGHAPTLTHPHTLKSREKMCFVQRMRRFRERAGFSCSRPIRGI